MGGMPGGPGEAGGAGGLAALANSPQLQRLREVGQFPLRGNPSDDNLQMVRENPAVIQPLLQQIATQNPQLAQLINQNPQALYELLGAGGEGEDEEEYGGPQVMQVNLTQDEAAAVERVRAQCSCTGSTSC